MSIVLVATLTPRPDHRDAVRSALTHTIPIVHAEVGCELYALHENRTEFVLLEQWRDKDALGKHADGEAFRKLQAQLDGLLETPMSIQSVRPVQAGSVAQGTLRS